MMAIDLRAAIQAKLEPRSLPVYVAGLRAAGRTWDAIAADLKDRTGIAVSRETLRVWFGDHDSKGEV